MAVGRRASDGDRPGHPAGAGPVLDQERLAEPLLQPLPEHARQKLGAAAGRERDHEGDGAARIGLRRGGFDRRARDQQSDQQAPRQCRGHGHLSSGVRR
jgi:hypothetical protein